VVAGGCSAAPWEEKTIHKSGSIESRNRTTATPAAKRAEHRTSPCTFSPNPERQNVCIRAAFWSMFEMLACGRFDSLGSRSAATAISVILPRRTGKLESSRINAERHGQHHSLMFRLSTRSMSLLAALVKVHSRHRHPPALSSTVQLTKPDTESNELRRSETDGVLRARIRLNRHHFRHFKTACVIPADLMPPTAELRAHPHLSVSPSRHVLFDKLYRSVVNLDSQFLSSE
jgi:hypothetical protein